METFEERQKRENEKTYRQWLSCGFVGEMRLNDCGWCVNGIALYKHENAKKVTLFDKHPFSAYIEYMQLPNKKWIAGSSLNCPLHGYVHGMSVWSKQYETKNEAVTEQINMIEKSLEEKDRKPFILNAIQTYRNEFKDSPFEMAFKPASTFEQVALF